MLKAPGEALARGVALVLTMGGCLGCEGERADGAQFGIYAISTTVER